MNNNNMQYVVHQTIKLDGDLDGASERFTKCALHPNDLFYGEESITRKSVYHSDSEMVTSMSGYIAK